MVYLVMILAAACATLAVLALVELVPVRPRAITRQLGAIGHLSRGESVVSQRPAGVGRARATELLRRIGSRVQRGWSAGQPLRELLTQAGYRRPEALTVYSGARLAAMLLIAVTLVLLAVLAGASAPAVLLAGVWGAVVGWLGPKIYLRQRARARRAEIESNLPDALDLLVVCVEAGLGLNQAMGRVAEEMRHFSRATAGEFAQVNLEIRAGVPRMEALRNLGSRMAVADLRSLSTMLIQADRFGTSVAQALRVHADTARQKRRHRAEEAAAKTSIKLLFPLVLCIFPTIFVVILGPAIINIVRTLSGL